MKRILTLLISVLLLCALALPVFAAEPVVPLVVDDAGLLTDEELYELQSYAQQTCSGAGFDIVIRTVEDTDGYDVETFTENIYHGYEYGQGAEHSGVILLLSMVDRSYDLYVYGRCDYLPYSYWTDVENAVLSYLGSNNWYGAFRCFISQSAGLVSRNRDMFNSDGSGVFFRLSLGKVITALIFGLIPALIARSILKSKMKSAVLQTRADRYAGQLQLRQRDDHYVRTDVVRVRHQESSSGGSRSGGGHSGGGGGSHHSGHF